MPVLALDTASEACSAAVLVDGRLVTRSVAIGRGHAEVLMPMVAEAMAEAAVSFDDLSRIVVTTGPGSFTGVRVAVAAARGFAVVSGLPVVGLSTLAVHAAMAREAHPGATVLAVLTAGRGEIYGAVYDGAGNVVRAPEAGSAAHFASLAAEGVVLAGSAADVVVDAGVVSSTVAHRSVSVDVGALARLGALAPEPEEAPRPLYIRPPDAKPQAAARIARR